MVDTNKEYTNKAYVGCDYFNPLNYRASLLGIVNRTTLLRKINDCIINEINEEFSNTKKDKLLSDIKKLAADDILDETNASLRINISLRL